MSQLGQVKTLKHSPSEIFTLDSVNDAWLAGAWQEGMTLGIPLKKTTRNGLRGSFQFSFPAEKDALG